MNPDEAITRLKAAGFRAWASRREWPKRINYTGNGRVGSITIQNDGKVDAVAVARVVEPRK